MLLQKGGGEFCKASAVVCQHVEGSVGAKPRHRLEGDAAGASLMQSQPQCLLGTGPHMWPLPDLAQTGFVTDLSVMHQNPAWKHVSS